ncbi:MAG: FlgD immunoglobulin-like domain containing protein, partial [Candidatus Marinimicrobia bacterium]|nr:FlgD immunoglobulin-like domain containing protein [Candidatus Neomarinimicrobiota bacterium]
FVQPENINSIIVKGMTLYFGQNIDVTQSLSYGLPPKPPAPSTDIRFSGNTRVCTLDECIIEVMNADQTLAIECDIKGNEDWEMVDERGEVYECSSDEMFMLNGNHDTLILRKSTTSISPFTYSISPAYPNPFNPVTTITYSLPEDSYISLAIYDMTGRLIKTLETGLSSAGIHENRWNGTNMFGENVPSGIYFCEMNDGKRANFIKLILMK